MSDTTRPNTPELGRSSEAEAMPDEDGRRPFGGRCEHEHVAITGGKYLRPYLPGCTVCGIPTKTLDGPSR